MSVDTHYAAIEALFAESSVHVNRFEPTLENWVGITVPGARRDWKLIAYSGDVQLTRLPPVYVIDADKHLAHVGYHGAVCVSDHIGLSMDMARAEDIVAHTILAAYRLLEKWDADDVGNAVEFHNEYEGYWLGLPSVEVARAAIAVDEKSRFVTFFWRGKPGDTCYVTEVDAKAPSGFRVDGLSAQRALYLHIPAYLNPPLKPQQLDVEYINEIPSLLDESQRALWQKLIRPSSNKNHPKQAVLLLSTPRKAGGTSFVAIAFGTRDGKVDTKAQVKPLIVCRHTEDYMRERGGASLALKNKHVAVIGCGAVGAVVADALAASGVGTLTLVDHDEYSEDNVFRHLLEPFWIGSSKVGGLRYELERHYPGLKVSALRQMLQTWWKSADFQKLDGIVVAIGAPALERCFSSVLRQKEVKTPVLFTWLEPLDIGGHSIAVLPTKDGCLDCIYRDAEGTPSLSPRTAFLVPDQPVSRNLTGCASTFVPYGAIQSRKTALMAAEHFLAALTQPDSLPSYRYWAGEGVVAKDHGLLMTPWWERASTRSFSEATNEVFGRTCKKCRCAA